MDSKLDLRIKSSLILKSADIAFDNNFNRRGTVNLRVEICPLNIASSPNAQVVINFPLSELESIELRKIFAARGIEVLEKME